MHTVKPDSAIAAEIRPEVAEWSTIFKTNVLLADIYDELCWFQSTMIAKGTDRYPKKPKEYPRSWREKKTKFKKIMKVNDWLKLIGGEKKDG